MPRLFEDYKLTRSIISSGCLVDIPQGRANPVLINNTFEKTVTSQSTFS